MLRVGHYDPIWNPGLGGLVSDAAAVKATPLATGELNFGFTTAEYRFSEIPPSIFAGPPRAYVFTFNRSVRGTNATADLTAAMAGGAFTVETSPLFPLISLGMIYDPVTEDLIPVEDVDLETGIYKRNYDGIYSQIPDGLGNFINVHHGETKNKAYGGVNYPMALTTNDPAGCDWLGEPDAWYNSFVSCSVVPVASAQSAGVDYGPVVWPATGYLNPDGTHLSKGVAIPSQLIVGNEHFIFYVDKSTGTFASGRSAGVRIAKAPIAFAGQAGHYKVYRAGTANAGWANDAMPAGYSLANIEDYLKEQGGAGTVIALTNGGTIRFAVAKITGLPLFMSICEQIVAGNAIETYIKVSLDLINWMGGPSNVGLSIGSYPNWGASKMHYAQLLSTDFNSNFEVGIDFYAVGGTPAGHNTKMPWIEARLGLPWALRQLRTAALGQACYLLFGRALSTDEQDFWRGNTDDISVPLLLQRYAGAAALLG